MPIRSQRFIKEKIRRYLRESMGEPGRDLDEDFIKKFEEGYCSGISSLWLYAKWRQTQLETYCLPIIVSDIDPDDVFVDRDWDRLAKGVIDSSWYEIRENLDELEKLLELSDEDMVVGLAALEGMEGFKRVVKNKNQLRKFILLGRSRKPDKVTIESEDWLRSVESIIDINLVEAEGILDKLKDLLKLSDIEVSAELGKLEGEMEALKSVVKNKKQLRSFILLRQHIKDNKLRPPISLNDLKRMPRDDYDWFMSIIDKIINWDGEKSSLSKDDQDEFERFIQYIQFPQQIASYLPVGQGELDKVLEDTEIAGRGGVEQKYSIGALFNLEQVKALLRKNIIQDHRLNLISSHNHAVGLFKDGGKYFFFDPNSETGEVVVSPDQLAEGEVATDKLAEIIFEKFGFSDGFKQAPIGFRIFAYDNDPLPPSPKSILAEIKPNAKPHGSSYKKYTGLMMATRMGSLESVEYFLEGGGADIDKSFFLMPKNLKDFFLKEHINVNARDEDGLTALIHAVARGHVEIMRKLLDYGAVYSVIRPNDPNIFVAAASFGYASIVREVLSEFGDSKVKLLGLYAAMKKGWFETVKVILEAAPGLLRLPYTSVLMYAAQYCKYPEIIREILKRGHYFGSVSSSRNKEVQAAFMIAAKNGNLTAVKVFLDRRFKWKKEKALRLAADNGHLNVVKELLLRGADRNSKNKEDETALMVAEKHGHSDIIAELQKDKVIADSVFNVLFGRGVFRDDEQNKMREDISKIFSLVYSDKEYATNHPLMKHMAAQYLSHSEWTRASYFWPGGSGIQFLEDFKRKDFSRDLINAVKEYKTFNENELDTIQELSSELVEIISSSEHGLSNSFKPYFDMIITSDLISRCSKRGVRQHLENILDSEEIIDQLGRIYIEAFKKMRSPKSIKMVLDESNDEFLRAFSPPEQMVVQRGVRA